MTKLEVKLHDGSKFFVEVTDYDVKAVEQKMNDNAINMVAIGNAVIQRHSIMRIIPVADIEVEVDVVE